MCLHKGLEWAVSYLLALNSITLYLQTKKITYCGWNRYTRRWYWIKYCFLTMQKNLLKFKVRLVNSWDAPLSTPLHNSTLNMAYCGWAKVLFWCMIHTWASQIQVYKMTKCSIPYKVIYASYKWRQVYKKSFYLHSNSQTNQDSQNDAKVMSETLST